MAEFNSRTEPGCIAGNLPLKVMRIAMENKGIFDKARPGALYYFTGEYNEFTVDGETYKIPKTAVVNGPENLKSFEASGTTYGIQFTVDQNNKITGATLAPVSNN